MMISRIAALAVAALVLPMATGAAQERPTVEDVLLRLTSGERNAGDAAADLLRQVHGPMTADEIAVLIDALVEMTLAVDIGQWPNSEVSDASWALVYAAQHPGSYVEHSEYVGVREYPRPGESVPGAFDALVRIYETRVARALATGGDDPFMEAAFRDEASSRTPTGGRTTFEGLQLNSALRYLFGADLGPDGRGWAYVLALFERSNPPCKEYDGAPEPPDCTIGPGSTWCAAGRLLHMTPMGDARPWPGPDPDLWGRRCGDWSNGWKPHGCDYSRSCYLSRIRVSEDQSPLAKPYRRVDARLGLGELPRGGMAL